MNPTGRKLTDAQKGDIRRALHLHRVEPSQERLVALYAGIEDACNAWDADRIETKRNRRIPPKKLERQLLDLDRALNSLSDEAFLILRCCESDTRTRKALGSSLFWHKLTCDLSDTQKSDDWFSALWIARHLLSEATRIAVEAGGSLGADIDRPTALEAFASFSGRPQAPENVRLVAQLIQLYQEKTGRRASDTPKGPFEDFVAAVFSITKPGVERTNFRNLIRTAQGRRVSRNRRKKA